MNDEEIYEAALLMDANRPDVTITVTLSFPNKSETWNKFSTAKAAHDWIQDHLDEWEAKENHDEDGVPF